MTTPTGERWSLRQARTTALRHSWGLRGLCATPRPGWRSEIACAGVTALFYGDDRGTITQACEVCATCPVRLDCLADAFTTEGSDLSRGRAFGVRGGLPAIDRIRVYRAERRAGSTAAA